VGFLACPVCLGDLELAAAVRATNICVAEKKQDKADLQFPDPEVVDGILVCRSCARWYPVRDSIPELYPDHLRDRVRDLELLKCLAPAVGSEFAESLRSKNADLPDVPDPHVCSEGESMLRTNERTAGKARDKTAAPDPGASFKLSEMAIASRIDDPDFFGPGRTAPFNPAEPEYTTRSIRRFGVALTLLDLQPGAVVLDIGTGYAWTSEWLSRSGFVPIGLDICRSYLDIGLRRMGAASPHLVAADVENLPLKTGCLDAVLAFDAFHHVPDRPAAMRGFFRALKTPGRIVLAEPGPGHGTEPASVDVMEKYGILEKGMSRRDVASYCRGIPGASVREHHIFKLAFGSLPDAARTVSDLILAAASLVPARLRRALLPEKTLARLKKSLRYSDYRFFVVEKRG